MTGIGGRPHVAVVPMLMWLVRFPHEPCSCMMASILCWLGSIADMQAFWNGLETDAVVHAPIPMCGQRARRLDPNLVDAVALAGNAREIGRSGRGAMVLMNRFRKFRRGLAVASGNFFLLDVLWHI